MTKKHYEYLAKLIKNEVEAALLHPPGSHYRSRAYDRASGMYDLVVTLCGRFFPRFNEPQFGDACGINDLLEGGR